MANVVADYKGNVNAIDENGGPLEVPDEGGDQAPFLVMFLKGKGKGKGGELKGKERNGGTGLCFNCREAGYVVSKCDKPTKDNIDKWGGEGKGKT